MNRRQVTYGHRSFVFNQHLNADGTVDPTKVKNTVVLDQRQTPVQFLDMRDPFHVSQGGALGRVHKGFLELRLTGRIEVPDADQRASLADKEFEMRAAFDPYLCTLDSPTTEGAYPLDFFEPTTDTGAGRYPSGWMDLRYYMRPTRQPAITESVNERGSRQYSVFLVAADPRCFEQSESTLSLSPGTASGNVVNKGNVPAPLKATITMSGAGASNFTITRSGVAFVLNLSGMVNNDVVVVVFEPCAPYGAGRLITKNGVRAHSLKTSAPGTWLDVPAGTASFAITNTTNVTSCVLAWRSARA